MTPTKSLVLATLLLAPLSGATAADSITKTDGTVLTGVTIVEEGLDLVTYKDGRTEKTVPSEEVASVAFDAYPEDVDEALGLLAENNPIDAVQYVDAYVEDQLQKPSERKYKWAPAYAAHLAVVLRQRLFDLEGMAKAADRLVKGYPKSRYVPSALLAKARAQAWGGSSSGAKKALDQLGALIESQGLGERWKRELELARIDLDAERKGPEKRAALADIARAAEASDLVVWGHARVAEGESYLQEAEASSASKAKDLRAKARRVFEDVIGKDGVDARALAGAYAGLGDCDFFAGADADDADVLKRAATHYLRVVLSYPDQGQYVPRALFYAMRSFDLMGDKSRARDMKRALLSLYGGTSWADRPEVKN